MTAMSAVGLLLRRLRTEGAILVLLFTLVGLTSFLFAAAPRQLNRVSDDALRYAVASASAADRDVWLYASGFIQAGTDPGVAAAQADGDQRETGFPASIDHLIGDRLLGITSVGLVVPQSIVGFTLRYKEGLMEASRLTSGRWRVDRGMPLQQVHVG